MYISFIQYCFLFQLLDQQPNFIRQLSNTSLAWHGNVWIKFSCVSRSAAHRRDKAFGVNVQLTKRHWNSYAENLNENLEISSRLVLNFSILIASIASTALRLLIASSKEAGMGLSGPWRCR